MIFSGAERFMGMDWKLELVVVPVSDVDRSKAFYSQQLGFNVDVDYQPNENFRVVQLTPPGSACSITIGTGVSGGMAPGCIKGLHLVVQDIDAAITQLTERGVKINGPVHFEDGKQVPGVDPNRADYGSFIFLEDPDGNGWQVQEVRRGAGGS
jgi:catechol 2,3-dioxygenase-like lactoylglutathione lyase family enzyme